MFTLLSGRFYSPRPVEHVQPPGCANPSLVAKIPYRLVKYRSVQSSGQVDGGPHRPPAAAPFIADTPSLSLYLQPSERCHSKAAIGEYEDSLVVTAGYSQRVEWPSMSYQSGSSSLTTRFIASSPAIARSSTTISSDARRA